MTNPINTNIILSGSELETRKIAARAFNLGNLVIVVTRLKNGDLINELNDKTIKLDQELEKDFSSIRKAIEQHA